jgi:hypothetical protein
MSITTLLRALLCCICERPRGLDVRPRCALHARVDLAPCRVARRAMSRRHRASHHDDRCCGTRSTGWPTTCPRSYMSRQVCGGSASKARRLAGGRAADLPKSSRDHKSAAKLSSGVKLLADARGDRPPTHRRAGPDRPTRTQDRSPINTQDQNRQRIPQLPSQFAQPLK